MSINWNARKEDTPSTDQPTGGTDDSSLDNLFGEDSPVDTAWSAPVAREASTSNWRDTAGPSWGDAVEENEEDSLEDLFGEEPVQVSVEADAAETDDFSSLFSADAPEQPVSLNVPEVAAPMQTTPVEAFSWNTDSLAVNEPEVPSAPAVSTDQADSGLDDFADLFDTDTAVETTFTTPSQEEPTSWGSQDATTSSTPPAAVSFATPVEKSDASAVKNAPEPVEEVIDWSSISAAPVAPTFEDTKDSGISLTGLAGVRPPTAPKRRASAEERLRQRKSDFASGQSSKEYQQALKEGAKLQLQRSYKSIDHLWPDINTLLGWISNQPGIQLEVGRFQLTRDPRLDRQQRRYLEELISRDRNVTTLNIQTLPQDLEAVYDAVYDEMLGISVLGHAWRDDEVTEIMVDDWDRVTVERGGVLVEHPARFRDRDHAQRVARDMANNISGRGLSRTNPMLTAQLPGARVTFAYEPVVQTGVSITLRKFRKLMNMDGLLGKESLTPLMAEFLADAVLARATVLVSGGTGTGKTTMINALSQYIPDTERVVTIEDNFELTLSNRNTVSMQTKERASADDAIIIGQAELFENTLRMRPDRVIVGEIREGEGATVMLRAANTGHDGTMTTIHANSAEMAVNERFPDLLREVSPRPDEVAKRTVASGIDLVVQVTRKHGKRFISEISVVDRTCMKDGNLIPHLVFRGDINAHGDVTFAHVGEVRPETALGVKFVETGLDLDRWKGTK